ncbi:PadR family transcriptional regulator (plasmid) [Arthrobacter sp. ERGS1:01]|uniref:PadR family transcriptional regulator n=1 Tax=Arthrobacter sp. ERGS1:01 TaxID=1704044 RepID=UPI0006B62387|nr:helix-turn-helix transcriptional regulator [Arthrobacter sp. ERGS1:01]ALE04756.1 PadR family transcriptional regulator [Arthrobacter sp. ERGS1:01]
MEELQRLTAPTVDVLRVLLATSKPIWGLLIIKESGRVAGTVYPALERLEEAGWLSSYWEADSDRSGPRRRYYELTVDGVVAARRAVSKFDARPVRVVARPAGAQA